MNAFLPKVLFMENERVFRQKYSEGLQKERELKVLVAPTAALARHHLSTNRGQIAAAVIDIKMSNTGSEGLDIIAELRNKQPFGYIEAVTAFDHYKAAALSMGADDVIIKPARIGHAAQRVKNGIMDKKIEHFLSVSNLDLRSLLPKEGMINFNSNWVNFIYDLDSSIKKIEEVKHFVYERGQNFGLTGQNKSMFLQELVFMIAKTLLRKYNLVSDQHEETMKENQIDPDRNKIALGDILHTAKGKYNDEYLVIVDGQLVDHSLELDELLFRIEVQYPENDRLIHKMGSSGVAKIRGPKVRIIG